MAIIDSEVTRRNAEELDAASRFWNSPASRLDRWCRGVFGEPWEQKVLDSYFENDDGPVLGLA